jgi:hypothetical protein
MESSSARLGTQARRRDGTHRVTQVGLLVASLGALLIIFDLFGLGIVGIFLVLAGTALAAPGGVGHGWFIAVVAGAIIAVASRLIAEESEVIGGWLAVIGSVSVLIGATLGFPTRSPD